MSDNTQKQFTYQPSKHIKGMYTVFDRQGRACGWVSEETKRTSELSSGEQR